MTTIRLTGGVLGDDKMLIRCNLSEASSPVEVSRDDGETWHGTQYQCADARHRDDELADLGIDIAESVPGVGTAETIYEWEVLGGEDKTVTITTDDDGFGWQAFVLDADGEELHRTPHPRPTKAEATTDGYRWARDNGYEVADDEVNA